MVFQSELLKSGVRLHVAGQLEQARKIYEQVLDHNPNDPNALNVLGLLGWQTGQFDEAVEHLRRAIEIDNSQAAYFANLGEALRGLGQFDEAIRNYERAIRLQPSAAVAHSQLASLHEQAGSPDKAMVGYERALRIETNHPESLTRLARLHKQRGNLPAAEDLYRRAVQANPGVAPLHFDLANVLQMQGRLGDAIDSYRKAIEMRPEYPEAYCNLGNALREQGRFTDALEPLRRAVELGPNMAAPRSNLGAVLQDLGRLDEARQCFERALELDPGRPEIVLNMGIVSKDQGRVDEALAWFERALEAQPDYAQAVCSRGAARLSLGHFAPGWVDYERRIECPQYNTLRFSQPLWDGSPLGDRRLLVHAEQGLGDMLQFVRYLPLVRQRGEHVTLAVEAPLVPLFEHSGYAPLVTREPPFPAFDVHAPLMSLPRIFSTTLDSVPADVPYLSAEPARVERWRGELEKYPGLRVGIAWQGRPTFRGDPLRSIPLAQFEPLARVEGVRLISLQKVFGTEQLAEVAPRFEVVNLGPRLDADGAFLDTAAVMQSLDLVICSDTAAAHLAGALGVRVWVALNRAPDWRWMLDREDSPWYPTMRLFRQTELGRWSDVFERIAEALRSTGTSRPPDRSGKPA
jgi:tetratricopeptide (TPR) repeat protein